MRAGLPKAVGLITIIAAVAFGLCMTNLPASGTLQTSTLLLTVPLAVMSVSAGLIAYHSDGAGRWVLALPALLSASSAAAILLIFNVGFFVLMLPTLVLISSVGTGMRANWEAI